MWHRHHGQIPVRYIEDLGEERGLGNVTNDGGLTVILRTNSDIEASVVRSLLETHGIYVLTASDVPHSVFPLTIDGLGEVRLSVRDDQSEEAARVIADYRVEVATRMMKKTEDLAGLESTLGYSFRDKGLLEHALTHRSRAHEDESGGVVDNESLEFLGDAVLELVISDRLFREFPDYDEGQKSKTRAQLVSAPTLAHLGQQIDLGVYLMLGRGEEKTGGRSKPSLLADGLEAVVAAIYLDGGMTAADAFIERLFRPALNDIQAGRAMQGGSTDHKSALQEWLHAHARTSPEYVLVAEWGPDHDKTFEIEVRTSQEAVGRAEGRSKKEAEQRAAERALEALRAP